MIKSKQSTMIKSKSSFMNGTNVTQSKNYHTKITKLKMNIVRSARNYMMIIAFIIYLSAAIIVIAIVWRIGGVILIAKNAFINFVKINLIIIKLIFSQ